MSSQKPPDTTNAHKFVRILRISTKNKRARPPVFKPALANPAPPHHSGFRKIPHLPSARSSWWSTCTPAILLLCITTGAWLMYQLAHWTYQWESRSMHVILFTLWTTAWHATMQGALAKNLAYQIRSQLRWRLSLRPGWIVCRFIPGVVNCIVPPSAAVVGELVQDIIPGSGHTPEWAGAGFSLFGVACGSVIFWAWTCTAKKSAAEENLKVRNAGQGVRAKTT